MNIFGTTGSDFDGRRVGMQQILIADHEHSLGHPAFAGLARSMPSTMSAPDAPPSTRRAEAVDVRMIPIEPWRLVRGDAEAIFECWPRPP